MEGKTMTLISNFGYKIATFSFVAAATFAVPLAAEDTLVTGRIIPKDQVEQRVGYSDLNLREIGQQKVLISRVRQAARDVCDEVLKDEAWDIQFFSRCRQTSFANANHK
jgi:UrcA family protein